MELSALHSPLIVLAYIDAGTGSMIIQVIIGALAGGLLALKIFWGKVKRLFRKNSPEEKAQEKDQMPGG
ncbi:MAG: hypothetical protein NUV31_01300 [Dehalococcoidales bacterium]|nr:hypothetical protein [Dehalococcoidales bacterium]